ncbi:MAG: hypothetical protein IJS61_04940 [Firmicutes bacterium]|nr:hypothetical protein [Bacillota bacterium]
MSSVEDGLILMDEMGKLDSVCKLLLSKKQVLARILRLALKEYSTYTDEEIITNFIKGEPSVADIPVHRDDVTQLNTEDKTATEGTAFYDVLFNAVIPGTNDTAEFIINIEAQNKYHTKYPLLRRTMYYCSRLISAQKDKDFTKDNYQDIKKVFSIWICFTPNEKNKNTISRYKITKEDVFGKPEFHESDYDIMEGIMICLGDDENKQNELLGFLEVFFTSKKKTNEKKQILKDNYGMDFGDDETEVFGVCNYSEYVLEQGIEQGIKQGIEQGIEKGAFNTLTELVKEGLLTLAQAAQKAGMSVAEFQSKAQL